MFRLNSSSILTTLLLVLHCSCTLAVAQQTNGLTTSPGIIFPKNSTDEVFLKNHLIEFGGFEDMDLKTGNTIPVARYKALYELDYQGSEYTFLPVALPFHYYFTDFEVGSSSPIIEYIATLMPDLITLGQSNATVLGNLTAKFENRTFIRKFLNKQDLNELGISLIMYQNEKRVKIDRVSLEFEMAPGLDGTPNAALLMKLNAWHNITVEPGKPVFVKFEFISPTFEGNGEKSYKYAPYITSTARNWGNALQNFYISYPMGATDVILPSYFDYEAFDYGYKKSMISQANFTADIDERIAFYQESVTCNCEGIAGKKSETVFIPNAIRSVSASSYSPDGHRQFNACFQQPEPISLTKPVPTYANTIDPEPNFITNLFFTETTLSTRTDLSKQLTNECEGSDAFLSYKEYHHPVWAFDQTFSTVPDQESLYFNKKTAWCENASGPGIEQYIEFTVSQPIKRMKFHTGLQKSSEDYNENNRVKKFEILELGGKTRKQLIFSDKLISTSYDLDLPAGTYRMFIKEIYKGTKTDKTCFGSVDIFFASDDAWLNEHYEKL